MVNYSLDVKVQNISGNYPETVVWSIHY